MKKNAPMGRVILYAVPWGKKNLSFSKGLLHELAFAGGVIPCILNTKPFPPGGARGGQDGQV